MMSKEKVCRLCNAIGGSPAADRPLYNTPVFTTDHFVVLPALGPLCVGHILLITKKHYTAFSELSPQMAAECEQILLKLSGASDLSLSTLLLAEHGSGADSLGAACITHAHLHVFPELSHLVSRFDYSLETIQNNATVSTLSKVPTPYIFVGTASNGRVFSSINAPCQAVRRFVARELQSKDWDWTIDDRNQIIRETFEFWNQKLKP